MHGLRHALCERGAAEPPHHHPADAEHAVQRRHDRPPERLFDGARLRVHRDVERRHAGAEHRQHGEQHPVGRRDENQRQLPDITRPPTRHARRVPARAIHDAFVTVAAIEPPASTNSANERAAGSR